MLHWLAKIKLIFIWGAMVLIASDSTVAGGLGESLKKKWQQIKKPDPKNNIRPIDPINPKK